jgi:hypothetical protein
LYYTNEDNLKIQKHTLNIELRTIESAGLDYQKKKKTYKKIIYTKINCMPNSKLHTYKMYIGLELLFSMENDQRPTLHPKEKHD